MTQLFEAGPDGITMTLPGWLVEFLADIPPALAAISAQDADPAAQRLHVPVYLDDPEANEEYWRWMGSELEQSRAADRSAFALVLESCVSGPVVMSRAETEAFLRVLVEARLAVAARLGVEVEEDYEDLAEGDAGVLEVLGGLQLELLEALGAP